MDTYGDTLIAGGRQRSSRPAEPRQVAAALPPRSERGACGGPVIRAAVVSAADPVDRKTGRLVSCPTRRSWLGELDPAAVLRPLVSGPVIVDNDVNWAARAEREAAGRGLDATSPTSTSAKGSAAAIVSDGEVMRGHAGLAGEVAHITVPGPGAARFIDVFSELGLRRPGTSAIDVGRLLAMGARRPRRSSAQTLAHAISGVLAAVTALGDPEFVVVGGSWGTHPPILDAITARATRMPRQVPVRRSS